jgi:hypothetical protein
MMSHHLPWCAAAARLVADAVEAAAGVDMDVIASSAAHAAASSASRLCGDEHATTTEGSPTGHTPVRCTIATLAMPPLAVWCSLMHAHTLCISFRAIDSKASYLHTPHTQSRRPRAPKNVENFQPMQGSDRPAYVPEVALELQHDLAVEVVARRADEERDTPRTGVHHSRHNVSDV